MTELKEQDLALYRLLEIINGYEPSRWLSKEELLEMLKNHFVKSEGTHDICADFNTSRLRLNKARAEGNPKIRCLILLKSHRFKIASNKEEVEKYCKRDLNNALKLLKRYWQNMGVIKEDGQGRLLDANGNVIDDDSLLERFYDPFNQSGKGE